ncbi:hypothetical protein DSM112329_02738 [Paraconexibacter sp. AEG42_29]|uniref:Uncharacterized protein n=1 Tax=Paraconexibacter sp. AEG42_29 TaxID=2997339 RepID=A0AAU7AW65_9ACTN
MPWWRFDPSASLHDRVRFHAWRALAFGLVVGLVLASLPAGVIFALGYGPLTAGIDEGRRRRSKHSS